MLDRKLRLGKRMAARLPFRPGIVIIRGGVN
jgi:hypothetical protein